MFTKRITAALVGIALLVCAAYGAERIAAKDIRITFAISPAAPERDVPREARRAGVTPELDAKRGSQSQIEFGIVRDPHSHGALSKVVAGRISAITVTWADAGLLKKTQDTDDFLRRLLTTRAGSTYTYVPWAQSLGVPQVAATVEHTDGKNGRWLVWYAWPSVYCAYQDGAGQWWFGAWFQDGGISLETKKTETR